MARSCASIRRAASARPATRSPAAPTRTSAGSSRTASGIPFRFTFRPGTSELWVGDVGWNDWEEIDRIATPTSSLRNFGWPCYEGTGRQSRLRRRGPVDLREPVRHRRAPSAAPYYTYNHAAKVVAGETCPTGSSSITGLAFYHGRHLPRRLRRRAVLRRLLAELHLGHEGRQRTACRTRARSRRSSPAPRARSTSRSGPGGDLFYVDMNGGTIRRIRSTASGGCADRGHRRQPDQRPGAAHGAVRRDGIQRPRERHADLRLGPRR